MILQGFFTPLPGNKHRGGGDLGVIKPSATENTLKKKWSGFD